MTIDVELKSDFKMVKESLSSSIFKILLSIYAPDYSKNWDAPVIRDNASFVETLVDSWVDCAEVLIAHNLAVCVSPVFDIHLLTERTELA